MHIRLPHFALAAVLAPPLAAQSTTIEQIGGIGPQGNYRHDVALAIRDNGYGNFRFVTSFTKRDHSGWADNPADPATHLIESVYYFVADTNAATTNTYSLWVYAEDLTNPGNPDPASAQGPFGPFATPGTGTGGVSRRFWHDG